MNTNIRALVLACEKLAIPYRYLHPSQNAVDINHNGRSHLFINWSTPLNSQTHARLCEDKDYFYSAFKQVICMPKTFAYLSPYVSPQYQKYLEFTSIDEISKNIHSHLPCPCIIKRNRGSMGNNVFLAKNQTAIQNALKQIFNLHSANYDYVALAQAAIDIKKEYRAIFVKQQLRLLYEKDISHATFQQNLSPLRWDGGKAILVTDTETVHQIENFTQALFRHLPINYCGLDIILDHNHKLYLIEANSSPGFEFIARDTGIATIVDLYQHIIAAL